LSFLLILQNQNKFTNHVKKRTFDRSHPVQFPKNILRGEFSLLPPKILASFCRIPLVRGVALLPTRPCFAGVFGVVFKRDDIDPKADRFTGDEDTMLAPCSQLREYINRIALIQAKR
jgi:hypothetical protein